MNKKKAILICVIVVSTIIAANILFLQMPTNPTQKGLLQGTVKFSGLVCSQEKPVVPPCSGPYPNYEVVLFSQNNDIIKTKSDGAGNYKLTLDPGKYYLNVQGKPSEIVIESNKTINFDINIMSRIR